MLKFLRDLKQFWKESPRARFWTRTATAAVGGGIVGAYLEGSVNDWDTLKGAVIASAIKFAVGFFTPEEPFVGVNKTAVTTPAPPPRSE